MKTKLFPVFLLIFACIAFSTHTSSALSHEGEVHTILETSEEHKQKIQECLALPNFQDSCYIELCGEEGTYLCTEDILDAVVQLADPQTAMDVLNGIMQSDLFDIQTNGHLLGHVIGNSLAHHYGFSGETFLRCPEGFQWACTHGFFEDALLVQSDPVQAAVDICDSVSERPISRRSSCYHGVGHIFVFHTAYDMKTALSMCDRLPSLLSQERCFQGAFMERNEKILEMSEELGFREDDILAPCNRLENRYRASCYINHAAAFVVRGVPTRDAFYACLDAGYYTHYCIGSLGTFMTSPVWQKVLFEINGEPYTETTLIENAVYLCGLAPAEWVLECQKHGMSQLIGYDKDDYAREFCFYWNNPNECFFTIGSLLSSISPSDTHAKERCERLAPEEYINDCIRGTKTDYSGLEIQGIQNDRENGNRERDDQIVHDREPHYQVRTQSNSNRDEQHENSVVLSYLFIGLGCTMMITPSLYYFYRK